MFIALFAASTLLAPPTCREPVLKAERRWVQALEAGDRGAVAALLADDFTDFDWRGGVRTKAEVVAAVAPHPGELVLHNVEVQASREIGVVRGVAATRGPDGRETRAARFTDVFMCRDGRWRAVAAQETAVLPQAPAR